MVHWKQIKIMIEIHPVGIAQQIANSSQYCLKFWELFSLCAGADDYYFFQNRTASPEMVVLTGFYI